MTSNFRIVNILQLGSWAYSHYLDRFAVPYISQTLYSRDRKGWKSYSLIIFTLPGIKPNPPCSQTVGGQRQAGRASIRADWRVTASETPKDYFWCCYRWVWRYQCIRDPHQFSLSVTSQWAPRPQKQLRICFHESCPCQDTLCSAFFKKYLVYFF